MSDFIPFQLTSVTIANGASLSDVIVLGRRQLTTIVLPSGWTAADISFSVSMDGVSYVAKPNSGTEYLVSDLLGSNPVANQVIEIPYGDFTSWTHVKIRSGTVSVPVAQGAERVIRVGLNA